MDKDNTSRKSALPEDTNQSTNNSYKNKKSKVEGSVALELDNTINLNLYLRIIHIDVAQGESTLFIVGLEGEEVPLFTALIDGGKTQYVAHIIPTLAAYGVNQLDAIINSHYDADHIEGLTALLTTGNVPITRVYARSDRDNVIDDKRINFHNAAKNNFKLLESGKDLVDDLVDGFNKNTLKSCTFSFKCIAINRGTERYQDENNNSAAFLVTFGNFKYFTAGDLTTDQEDKLLSSLGTITAFKCGHHGSKHSTSETFLNDTNPKVAFISAGKHSYCHPDEFVLQRLQVKKIPVYLTNCCYNRPQVNKNYVRDEIQLIETYKRLLNDKLTDLGKKELNDKNYILINLNESLKKIKDSHPITDKNCAPFKTYIASIKEMFEMLVESTEITSSSTTQNQKVAVVGNDVDDEEEEEVDEEKGEVYSKPLKGGLDDFKYVYKLLKGIYKEAIQFSNYNDVDATKINAVVSGCGTYLGNVELYYRTNNENIFHVGYADSSASSSSSSPVVKWINYNINGGIADQTQIDGKLVKRERTVGDYQPPFSLPSLATKEEKPELCDCGKQAIYFCESCTRRVCEVHATNYDRPNQSGLCENCMKAAEKQAKEQENISSVPQTTSSGRRTKPRINN